MRYPVSMVLAASCLSLLAGCQTTASVKEADKYNISGDACLDRGDLNGAIADYTRAIELDPSDPRVYLARASARLKLNDNAGAITDCDHAIQLSIRDATTQRTMAATMAVPFSGSEAPTIRNDNFGRPLTHSSIRAETDGYLCEAAKLDLLTATAYSYRGAAKSNSGDQVGAIADCRHAIELDPKNANAYRARAHTRASQGDYTGAIADLDQAIQLDPLCADAYRLRGEIKDRLGDFEGALAAYLQSIRFANDDAAYSRFWVCLIGLRLRRGQPQPDLAAAVAGWKDGWPRTVGRFLTGDLSEAEFLAFAEKAEPKTANEQQCEACYYAGMLRLLRGDSAGAKGLFQRCLATGLSGYVEFGFARLELARIDTRT